MAVSEGVLVPEWIKKWRTKHQMSQADVGKMLKVSGQYVANIESGRNMAPVKFCLKLMKFLDAKGKVQLSLSLEDSLLQHRIRLLKKQASKRRR